MIGGGYCRCCGCQLLRVGFAEGFCANCRRRHFSALLTHFPTHHGLDFESILRLRRLRRLVRAGLLVS
jgi:hypothetical protein